MRGRPIRTTDVTRVVLARACLLSGALLLCAAPVLAQIPSVDPADRASVVSFYRNVYESPTGSANWTGNVGTCTAGTIDSGYLDAGLLRVEYFRAMAGLPTGLAHDASLDAKCQEAALMMTANNALSHSPPAGWTCYTAAGAEAAGKSNLALGFASLPDAVTGWILDNGTPSLGHRRWLLYPPQATVGVGATFGSGSSNGYAMWVLGPFGSRPVSPEWVAWPPPGFVPYPVVPALWSFSMQNADFSGASVTVARGTTPVSVVLETIQIGYGDDTLVWTPQGLPGGAPVMDLDYTVTVSNVMVSGSPREFAYTVTVIDPDVNVPTLPSTWGRLKARYVH